MPNENLGPAEKIIQTVLAYTDHAFHGRNGLVTPSPGSVIGVTWQMATHKVENGVTNVYRLDKVGKKNRRTLAGVLQPNGQVKEGARVAGDYRQAGLFPEVVSYLYRQVAEVWKLDNEFCARWASYAFGQEHRDLKTILAAFMLAQSRKGDPVLENGKILFQDEDFRDVGEAMMLLHRKEVKTDLSPKLLLRIRDVLELPAVAKINNELGFGKSTRHPFLGRWTKATSKWLLCLERNPRMLDGLLKAGFRSTVMSLAQRSGYKPETERLFEVLRWKQSPGKDGRRTMAIGKEIKAAVTWKGMTEEQICQRIMKEKPAFKVLGTLVPTAVGMTRAVVAAAIEAGCLTDRDLIMATPTLEELGLLQVQEIKSRWEKAVKNADDMRAANIATRVKSTAVKEKLAEASDNAVKAAVAEAAKNLRVYVLVDVSGSMERSIQAAKEYVAKFLQSFPPEQLHVATFNTTGRVVEIKHQSAAGVENAFRGVTAGGGTDHAAGFRALQGFKPKADEDALVIWIGDEEQKGNSAAAIRASGISPVAFGLVHVVPVGGAAGWRAANFAGGKHVRDTAAQLGIPCFEVSQELFADPYAVPRAIRGLILATPVGAATAARPAPVRAGLIDLVLATPLLSKPGWAQ